MYSFSDSPFFLARKGGASQQRSSRVRNRVRPFHRSKSPLARFSSPLSIAARTFSKTSRASASNFARFASGTAIRPASIMLPSFFFVLFRHLVLRFVSLFLRPTCPAGLLPLYSSRSRFFLYITPLQGPIYTLYIILYFIYIYRSNRSSRRSPLVLSVKRLFFLLLPPKPRSRSPRKILFAFSKSFCVLLRSDGSCRFSAFYSRSKETGVIFDINSHSLPPQHCFAPLFVVLKFVISSHSPLR